MTLEDKIIQDLRRENDKLKKRIEELEKLIAERLTESKAEPQKEGD